MLLRQGGRPLVIGHRGAAAVAPENTLESLEAAVAAGADLVEFDLQPSLELGHSSTERPGRPLGLDEALGYLASTEVGVHLDLKLPGYEAEAVAALHRHGLGGRALIATAWAASSRAVAALAPGLPVAIGYPRDRYGVSRLPWPAGAGRLGAAALRPAMPARARVLLRTSRATAIALHHTLCTRAAVRAAHRLGVPVLVWPVNDPARAEQLAALGVDGIVTDDPALVLATLGGP